MFAIARKNRCVNIGFSFCVYLCTVFRAVLYVCGFMCGLSCGFVCACGFGRGFSCTVFRAVLLCGFVRGLVCGFVRGFVCGFSGRFFCTILCAVLCTVLFVSFYTFCEFFQRNQKRSPYLTQETAAVPYGKSSRSFFDGTLSRRDIRFFPSISTYF